jgi:hypothetical protein
MARGLRNTKKGYRDSFDSPEESMKNSHSKHTHRNSLFFFFLLLSYFFMPSPSGGSLRAGAMIGANAFEPGTMLLLGTILIGLAAWGRKKFEK